MAIISNLIADQGSAFNAIIDLVDSNGEPLNLTGQLFRGQFRKNYTSSTASGDFICEIMNASTGQIIISLPANITRYVKPGRYVYDIEMYDENDTQETNTIRVIEGQIEFTPGATSTNVAPPPVIHRLSGAGSPEGIVSASPGYSYIDTTNGTLYFKMTGIGSTGWQAFVQL